MPGKSSLNSKIPKDRNFDYAVKLIRITLSICGLWPLNENNRFFNGKFLVALISLMIMFASSFAFMFHTENKEDVFDCLINTLVMLVMFLKLLMVRYENDKLKVIMYEMRNDWKKYERFSKRKKELVNLYARKGRTSSFICIFYVECSTITYLISKLAYSLQQPAEIRQWKLLYSAVYPFEVTSSLFVPIYLWQLFTILSLGSVAIAMDCLLMTTAYHATGQLAVLCEDIKGYRHGRGHRDRILGPRIECSCIKCIIERHVDIIRYCKLLEDAYNLILLTEFIGITFNVCLQMYIVVIHSNQKDVVGILSFCVYLILSNFRLYMNCNVLGAMVETGEKVGTSAYEINWYDFHPEAVRQLMLCILRANKPLNVTAGKFFSLNRNSYKNIIMSSSSYASVLLTIK